MCYQQYYCIENYFQHKILVFFIRYYQRLYLAPLIVERNVQKLAYSKFFYFYHRYSTWIDLRNFAYISKAKNPSSSIHLTY